MDSISTLVTKAMEKISEIAGNIPFPSFSLSSFSLPAFPAFEKFLISTKYHVSRELVESGNKYIDLKQLKELIKRK